MNNTNEFLNNIINNIINKIGSIGAILLFGFSLYLLRNKHSLFMYYLYGSFLNVILNIILKGMIKQPRPSENQDLFKIALKHSNNFNFVHGFPYYIFGMPSGHAQTAFYSIFFIYLALDNIYITLFYLLIGLITLYQRVKFNHHTILQVIVGVMVGLLFAFFIYYMSQRHLTGKLTPKKDDNAFYIF